MQSESKRRRYLEPIVIAMFGPAMLLKWYCSPSFRQRLKSYPGMLRRGPIVMIRILAKHTSSESLPWFGVSAFVLGGLLGAFLNAQPALGTWIGVGLAVALLNLIPLVVSTPSEMIG